MFNNNYLIAHLVISLRRRRGFQPVFSYAWSGFLGHASVQRGSKLVLFLV